MREYGHCDKHAWKVQMINLDTSPSQLTVECLECGMLKIVEPHRTGPDLD